jgi:hypothetical protein
MRARRIRGALAFAAAAAATAGYLMLRRLGERWGATDDELRRPLPGDEALPNPQYQTTGGQSFRYPYG